MKTSKGLGEGEAGEMDRGGEGGEGGGGGGGGRRRGFHRVLNVLEEKSFDSGESV